MNWLGKFYQWFWFHTEFWLTPVNRRPYTFIMRDWMFTHTLQTVVLIVVWIVGLVALCFTNPLTSLILGMLSMFLLAHLVWGSKWIEKQQEEPAFLG